MPCLPLPPTLQPAFPPPSPVPPGDSTPPPPAMWKKLQVPHVMVRASTFMRAHKCARTRKDLREPRVIMRVMWIRCTRVRCMQLLGCWWCTLARTL